MLSGGAAGTVDMHDRPGGRPIAATIQHLTTNAIGDAVTPA
jgi:hypothetical protein